MIRTYTLKTGCLQAVQYLHGSVIPGVVRMANQPGWYTCPTCNMPWYDHAEVVHPLGLLTVHPGQYVAMDASGLLYPIDSGTFEALFG